AGGGRREGGDGGGRGALLSGGPPGPPAGGGPPLLGAGGGPGLAALLVAGALQLEPPGLVDREGGEIGDQLEELAVAGIESRGLERRRRDATVHGDHAQRLAVGREREECHRCDRGPGLGREQRLFVG